VALADETMLAEMRQRHAALARALQRTAVLGLLARLRTGTPGMRRQETTKADTAPWALTPQQETAVDLLAVGNAITATAEAVGVARQTVSEWLHHSPAFQAALNGRRQELWQALTDRLRALAPKALDVLERELDSGAHALAAAAQVLKACGLVGVPAPSGPTDPEELALAARHQATLRQWLAATVE